MPVLLLLAGAQFFAQPNPPARQKGSAPAGAEVGLPVVQNFNTKDIGLFPETWTILQDRRGVMYAGISGGTILEYDGVTWRKIFTPTSVIRSLAMDDSGKIWVGANADFGYLAPDETGSMQFVSILDKVPADRRGFTSVWQTLTTPQGIFFRSYELLFRWDGQRMQVWSPTEPNGRFQALSAVRGHIYTAQTGAGLQEIVGDELRNAPGGDAYKASSKLFLHPYDDGRMLVSSRNGLLTLYDGAKVAPFPTQADDYLKTHTVYNSIVLADGSLCVGTLTGGAVILSHDGKLQQIIERGGGLDSSNALTVYQDRHGALWIGTDSGVSRAEVNSPISIFLRDGNLDAIRFQGSLYASSVGSDAVARLVPDKQTGRPVFVPVTGANQGWTLMDFKDPTGKTPDQLLASTSDGVLRVAGDKLVPTMPAVHGPTEQTYTVLQSQKTPNRVFIGHSDAVGSMRWDGKAWIDEGRLPHAVYEARFLVEDPEGILWASGGKGKVLRITVAPTGMRDSKFEEIGKEAGISDGTVSVGFVAGNIFAAVDRAKDLLRWEPATHKFVVDNRFLLPLDFPDASAGLFPFKRDDLSSDGSFWSVTTSSEGRRIGLFSKQPDGSWRVDEDTYRKLDRYGIYYFRTDTDGAIWVTGEVLIRFTPGTKQATEQSFPTLVRQVNAGPKVVFGGVTAENAKDLRLPPGSNNLRFQFAALAYENPSATEYQYLLEGADKDWSVWGKQTEANYSGLGPGSYTFRVRSRSDDGRKGEEATYAFTILPPWYRTTLAYIVYVLLFVLVTICRYGC